MADSPHRRPTIQAPHFSHSSDTLRVEPVRNLVSKSIDSITPPDTQSSSQPTITTKQNTHNEPAIIARDSMPTTSVNPLSPASQSLSTNPQTSLPPSHRNNSATPCVQPSHLEPDTPSVAPDNPSTSPQSPPNHTATQSITSTTLSNIDVSESHSIPQLNNTNVTCSDSKSQQQSAFLSALQQTVASLQANGDIIHQLDANKIADPTTSRTLEKHGAHMMAPSITKPGGTNSQNHISSSAQLKSDLTAVSMDVSASESAESTQLSKSSSPTKRDASFLSQEDAEKDEKASPDTSRAKRQKVSNDQSNEHDLPMTEHDSTITEHDSTMTEPNSDTPNGDVMVDDLDSNSIQEVDTNILPSNEPSGKASSPPVDENKADVSLPMLRNSPVDTAQIVSQCIKQKVSPSLSPMLVSKRVEDVVPRHSPLQDSHGDDQEKELSENAPETKNSPQPERKKKKKKKISWAASEHLEEVHFIDTRAELIKSWDPEYQITLPFAPTTLQMFQTANQADTAAQDAAAKGGTVPKGGIQMRSKPKITTFEEARKREHEMELERARRTREAQRKRLDDMRPKRAWKLPMEIVLPAECRKDPSEIEEYGIMENEFIGFVSDDHQNRTSPMSPPCNSDTLQGSRSVEVPVIPLSDGSSRDEKGFDTETNENSEPRSVSREAMQGFYRGIRDTINYRNLTSSAENESYSNTSRPSVSQPNKDGEGVSSYSQGAREPSYQNPILGVDPAGVQHILAVLKESGVLKSKGIGSGSNRNGHRESGYARQQSDNRPHRYEGQNNSHGRDSRPPEPPGYRTNNDHQSSGDGQRNKSPPHPARQMDHPRVIVHGSQMKPPPFVPGMPMPGPVDGLPFRIPPIPPPSLGMPPNMLPLGFRVPLPMAMPPLGIMHMPPVMRMNGPGQDMGVNPGRRGGMGNGRMDPIQRPKQKLQKQRKRCKYFSTKQGCRDGSACMFTHN